MTLDVSNIVREVRLIMRYLLQIEGLWQRLAAVWVLGLLMIALLIAARLPEILLALRP